MLGSPTIDPNPPSPADLGLTQRQVDVLALLMQGKSNKAIGRALVLAPPTVKSHVGAILRALDVTSRTQAVLKVAALGWNLRGDESSRRPEEGLATVAAMPTALAANGDAATGPQARPPRLAVPESASIVVLPFANMSGDPSQDYFADGMVEEITIALGRIPRLFVIASSSAFTYKGRAIGPQQIGAELGVRYILGGSVRKQSRQVRITVQLCDAIHGGQIWGDRFEGELSKVFELQDSVAASVSATIVPALRSAEIEQARRKPTANLSAYDLYLRALPPHRDSFAQNEESLQLLYRAIELEPSFAAAYGLAAFCHLMELVFDWRPASDARIEEGVRLALLAADKGQDDAEALWMAGRTLAALAGEVPRGLSLIGKSLALNPNSARAWWASGLTYAHLGECETALDHFGRARRLNPRDTSEHAHWSGVALAYLFSGNDELAMEAIDRALADWPRSPIALRTKAALCGLQDRIDDGRDCVRRLLALNPGTTVATVAFKAREMQSNRRGLERLLDGLRKAGLPEG